jgi:AbrB family looped-hinge helix DNA binding protein
LIRSIKILTFGKENFWWGYVMVSTMTSKGQLTVPKEVRDRMKIHAGDKLEFLFDETGICRIVPVTSSMKQLKGLVSRPDRPVSLKAMQEAIESRGNTE